MQNISIDLGNFDVKTSSKVRFTARYEEIKAEDKENYTGEEVLEFGDNVYFMGKGPYESKDNKTERNYTPLLLTGITKAVLPAHTGNINLCLGLPIRNINRKDKLIEELQGKTFEYKYKGESFKVTINKCGVLEEGMTSYYALPKEKRTGRVAIFDFGGKTVNGILFNNGKVVMKISYDKGILHVNDKILQELYKSFDGQSIREEDIEEYIDNDIYNLKEIANKQYKAYAKRVNKWLDKFGDLALYKVYCTGGAILRLEDSIREVAEEKLGAFEIMEDPRFTNVIGSKNIIDVKWRDKQ